MGLLARLRSLVGLYNRTELKIDLALSFLAIGYLFIYGAQVVLKPEAATDQLLEQINQVIYAVFAVDMFFRVMCWLLLPNRTSLFRFLGNHLLLIVGLFLPSMRALRALRAVLILQLLAGRLKTRAEQAIVFLAVSVPLIIAAASITILDLERNAQDATITDWGQALWWTIITLTTVGYGDVYPVTPEGRVVAGFLLVFGIVLFSTLTGLAANWLLASKSNSDKTA